VNLSVNLPLGLQLEAGETIVKTIPLARPFQDASVEWRVRATGATSGSLTYSVTASAAGVIPKTITRTINVPSLAQGLQIQPGIQMITFPYNFPNADVANVFVNEAGALPPIQLARWNPLRNLYEFYPTGFTLLEAGRSYWLRTEQPINLLLNGAAALPATERVLIPLKVGASGWNMVGSPFLHPEFIGALQVLINNEVIDFEEAVRRDIVRNALFFFDTVNNTYRFDTFQTRKLEPHIGYWIRVNRDATLVVPPPSLVNSIQAQRALTTSVKPPSAPSVKPGGWQLRVSAATSEGQDPDNFIGVSSDARDDFDNQDIEEPPPLNLPVVVNFPHPDWGSNSGKFARDLRSASAGKKVWDMSVETNLKSGGPVTLNFPNLGELPRNRGVSLTDLSTNKTVSLRSRRVYTFQASAGRTLRQFRLVVDSFGKGGTLQFTNVSFSPARGSGGIVTFGVTKSAKVQCVLLSPTGKTVRVLANNFSAVPGLNTLPFDGKNQQGAALGRGVYLLHFTATSDEEEVAQNVKVVNLK
jgi:hypothetical protein